MISVRELFNEYQNFLGFSLCFQGFDEELAGLPIPYDEPNGVILLAKSKQEIVGVVGLKKLDEGVCEMKRLYVKPSYQGFGLGAKLCLALIKIAQEKGY